MYQEEKELFNNCEVLWRIFQQLEFENKKYDNDKKEKKIKEKRESHTEAEFGGFNVFIHSLEKDINSIE